MCKQKGYCCNDKDVGSNQYVSCSQACYAKMVQGTSLSNCKAKCPGTGTVKRSCKATFGTEKFSMCSTCKDKRKDGKCPHGVQSPDECKDGCDFGAQALVFRLKGTSGQEQVEITVGSKVETHTLTKNVFQTFSYLWPSSGFYTVRFKNDAKGRDVVFKAVVGPEKSKAVISLPGGNWNSWKCGTGKENERCNMVRSGKFYWSGKYVVTVIKAASCPTTESWQSFSWNNDNLCCNRDGDRSDLGKCVVGWGNANVVCNPNTDKSLTYPWNAFHGVAIDACPSQAKTSPAAKKKATAAPTYERTELGATCSDGYCILSTEADCAAASEAIEGYRREGSTTNIASRPSGCIEATNVANALYYNEHVDAVAVDNWWRKVCKLCEATTVAPTAARTGKQ